MLYWGKAAVSHHCDLPVIPGWRRRFLWWDSAENELPQVSTLLEELAAH